MLTILIPINHNSPFKSTGGSFIFHTLAQHHLLNGSAALPISTLITRVPGGQMTPVEQRLRGQNTLMGRAVC